MDHLLKSSQTFAWLRSRPDDDSVDRFSRYQSVIILVFFGILIGIKQFLGTPIECWCPAQFTDSHRDYANEVCWANDKHYLPMSESIPSEELVKGNEVQGLSTSYYKLVPIIFILQALLTFAPCLLWRFLCKQSGINVTGILSASRDCAETSDIETKERAIRYIVDQMDSSFSQSMACRKLNGDFLPFAFFLIKFLYFINALSQLIFIDKFLETDYILHGLYVLIRLFKGQDWAFSSKFPRVILCGFEIRHQSRVHNYVVQCSLTNNHLNEKLFIFLWFWFLVLLLATIAYGVLWVILLIYWQGNVQFVRKQIKAKDVSGGATVQHFANNYLKSDGMLIIRLIDMNVGESVAGQVLRAVWESYSRERGVEQSKGEYGSKTNEPAYQSGPAIPFADPTAPGINPYYHVKSQN